MMIEEEAVVARIEDGQIWVEKSRKSACHSCLHSCPSATIGEYLGDKAMIFSISSDITLAPGDRIVVGVPVKALIGSALLVYLAPLVGLFLGATLGKNIGVASGLVSSDVAAMIGSIAGLLLMFYALRSSHLSSRRQAKPVVIRKLG